LHNKTLIGNAAGLHLPMWGLKI